VRSGKSRRTAKKNLDRAPQLGIFWLVNGNLIIDSSPLSEAEPYGDHMTHPRSHVNVWERFELSGRVLRGSEYEEHPRGRVMFDTTNESFTILADKCILNRKDMIAQIKKALHLSKKVKLDTDSHYRCPHCLRGKQTNGDEDWGE
jgi:hypothetical protein